MALFCLEKTNQLLFVNAFGQADGTSRADDATEMTADAFGADNMRLARGFVESDGLMTAITTRQFTTSAAHTPFTIDLRIDDCRTVQIGRSGKR